MAQSKWPQWMRTLEWMADKEVVIKEVSLFLLITAWTAVSTGRSYSSTLGKVELQNRCILVSEAGVARAGTLVRMPLCSVSGVCASWVEKMERTSRRWRTEPGAWDGREERDKQTGLCQAAIVQLTGTGSAHSQIGPDLLISAVHCCKCWLTWNAVWVRGLLSPSRGCLFTSSLHSNLVRTE